MPLLLRPSRFDTRHHQHQEPSASEWSGWFHLLLIVGFILILIAAVHVAGGTFEVGLP